jgi:lipopolysaccharide assembly outer membrane protein LptD (OstA)
MVLYADEVDYNEKSGEINARGNVHVTPVIPSPPR